MDETLALVDASGVSYPLDDSRGSPMALALPDGAIAVQFYGAFGEEGPANLGRIGFTGQMRIPELGLDYYKARFYDPALGRFLTPDPAGMIDGPNLYAYVRNDPINFTDPSGLEGQPPPPPPTTEVITVTGQRIPRGNLVDSGPCFAIPGLCTYHGGYITPIRPSPPASSPPMGMGEMMAMREMLCARINAEAERTRRNLPSSFNSNSIEGLRFERTQAQLDLQVISSLANATAFFGGVASGASALPVPGSQGLTFSRVSFGVGTLLALGLASLAERDTARIAAIDARLNQLYAKLGGVCN